MKRFITLLTLSWAAVASAQTADQFIAAGRSNLALTNWWGADTNFAAAVAASPGNATANALKAVTRLLVLPQSPAGSNFLVSLGFPKTNRWLPGFPLASLPKDINGSPIFPANYNSATVVSFIRTTLLTAITNSAANLAAITDPNYTLSLSPNETLIESVTVDYGDVQMLRAMLSAAQFFGYTLNENNLSTVIPTVQGWIENGTFTWQLALANYPSILALQNTGDLPASKSALTNAIANYLAASAFIRDRPANATNRLFMLDASETSEEAQFRTTLTNVLASLTAPTELNPGDIYSTVYTAPWFSGAVSLNTLLPKFNGNTYVNGSLPNYTFGGILPYQPAYKTEELLRKEFNSFAGIYGGSIYDYTFGDPSAGSFAAFISTNQQVTVVGYDSDSVNSDYYAQSGGIFAQFAVDQHGGWQFQSNNVSGYGWVDKSGSFGGELDFTNGDSVELYDGYELSALGVLQGASGYYTGIASGTSGGQSVSGILSVVLSADGRLIFREVDSSGEYSDGGEGQLGSNNNFTTVSVGGTTVSGTLNNSTFQFTGTFNSPDSSGTFSLSRVAKVPFDVPPVIKTNLALNISLPLGTNATFFLVVTGSPPMCFQWYDNNNVVIPSATTNKLVVSNLQYSAAGTYSVTINNVAGGTNASVTLTVTAETVPPVVSITNVTAGMVVSNSLFTVMGWATDNVAVASVFCAVSNSAGSGPWMLASTTNQWTNWYEPVNLTAGTNTLRAYAVDTSGNISTTNTVNFVYVVSATLTVTTNGLGSLNPNYNQALLRIGQNYAITATPATGFLFTNWTGGTSLSLGWLTNGTTVQFLMQSNLTLQANFVDVTKPTLSITNLTAGQRVSNMVFIVRGTAGDNWQISNVLCQINGGSWNSATNINNWTNWAAGVTLVPGTNIVAAYAVDTSGNNSTTNSVSFQYVVSAPLQLQITGLGTLNPNYSNAVLAVGQTYSMTASPGSGFVFTNWTGGTSLPLGWLTNGTTVQFLMQSNLILQANFVDVTKPILSITNLIAGQRVSNTVFTLRGTAADNWQVGNVVYQLNGGTWSNALTANNWTNWSGNASLLPGTNAILAYAVDTTGNQSTTNSVTFQFVVTNQLGVRATGLGTVSPNYSNAWLEVGRNYTMTASPGSGFVVTNWVNSTNWIGGTVTNNAVVQFMMASNLTLQVNFLDITKPTLTVSSPTANQHMTNALASLAGTASDNWRVAGVCYQLNSNAWDMASTTNGYTNWTKIVTLLAGTNTLKFYALDLGGNYSATNSMSVVSSNAFKLQLAFADGQPLASNGLNFILQVSTNVNGHILVSTDLVSWVALTNFVGTNATINFRDAAATNHNQRFYRAVTP